MMKKTVLSAVLATTLLGMASAQAGDFDGMYIGGKVGANRSNITGPVGSTASRETVETFGFEEGYNWDMGGFLVGGSFFADFNQKEKRTNVDVYSGSTTLGLDLKLGLPSNGWMPYAKIGWDRTTGSGAFPASQFKHTNDLHLGLGVEYKLAPSWSAVVELTKSASKKNGATLDNRNLTVGLNYYLGKEAAPAPIVPVRAEPAPEPVVEKPYVAPYVAPEPVVEKPAYVPPPPPEPKKEVWKTLLEEKPVTIEGALFDHDSAKLRPAAEKKLDEVVDFAKTYKDAQLDISGHTDSVGKDAYNMKLSEKRAESVKTYLGKKGVPAGRVTAKGFGEAKPVADNKTAEGRQKNRRVEIRSVIKEEKKVRVE